MVGDLKGSKIFIKAPNEGGELEEVPLEVKTFFNTIDCSEVPICDGFCKHVQYDRMDLNTILEKYGSFIQDHVLIVYSMKLISALAPYLQKDSENSYQLDKEKLLDTYKEQSTTERLFCPKYDDSEVSHIIEEFPSKIYYLSIEKLQDAFSTKWIAQEFPIIKQLVECSVLVQSLSMGEKFK